MRIAQPNHDLRRHEQHRKCGNDGDPNSYVHKDSGKETRTSEKLLPNTDTTSTTLPCVNREPSKSKKVTQLPNNVQSFSGGTLLSQNERRGNKHAVDEEEKRTNEGNLQIHQHNFMLYGSGGGDVKTFISNGNGDVMVAAAQQISHIRSSNENTSTERVLDSNLRLSAQQQQRDEVVDRNCVVRIMEKVHSGRTIDCDIVPSTNAEAISELRNCNSLLPSQAFPSSMSCSSVAQSQYHPETLHRNSADLHTNNSNSRMHFPSSSQNFQFQVENENSVDYYLRRNICSSPKATMHQQPPHAIDVTTLIRERNEIEHIVKCNLVDVNNIDENNRNSVNVNVIECNNFMSRNLNPKNEKIIDNLNHAAVNNVKIFTSTEKSSNESNDNNNNLNNDNFTGRKVTKSDNLTTITSAIENLANGSNHHTMMMMMTSDKEKITTLTNDTSSASFSSTTKKEKRRRDRRDRRLARTRANGGVPFYTITTSSNEIAPDVLNNHLPPPYADIPSQPTSMVPSVVSTVPVEDNRYTFSLPLVRR